VRTVVEGRCHCGNLAFRLETDKEVPALAVRACQCSFCGSHGARLTSDPAGRVTFSVRDESALSRYRFGLGTADFLVCRTCGFYAGAAMSDAGQWYAIVNVNAVGARELPWQESVPMNYDGEDTAGRVERRRERWTPARWSPGN
jgi:hypothetical protein